MPLRKLFYVGEFIITSEPGQDVPWEKRYASPLELVISNGGEWKNGKIKSL